MSTDVGHLQSDNSNISVLLHVPLLYMSLFPHKESINNNMWKQNVRYNIFTVICKNIVYMYILLPVSYTVCLMWYARHMKWTILINVMFHSHMYPLIPDNMNIVLLVSFVATSSFASAIGAWSNTLFHPVSVPVTIVGHWNNIWYMVSGAIILQVWQNLLAPGMRSLSEIVLLPVNKRSITDILLLYLWLCLQNSHQDHK